MITTESYGCDKHGEDAYQGCAMCDLEALRTDYALLSDDYKQLALDKESLRSRLAEAEALLLEIAGHRQAVAFFAPQLAGVIAALDRIDAHLARKP